MNETANKDKNNYDLAWFEQRAIGGLKKVSDGVWDYSDSLLLYLPGSDEIYEDVQNKENPYYEFVTAPERKYLQEIAQDVVKELPEGFDFIDLGPGTEHKEQFIFDAAKAINKTFIYHPVDISRRYLQLVEDHASQQRVPTESLRVSFEEVPKFIISESSKRFVSLGLTYGNYAPDEALKLLKQIAGDGKIFINTQIRDRIDTNVLKTIYEQVVREMSKSKLKLLGLDIDSDVSDIETTDEVKVWLTIKNVPPALETKGVRVGDKMLIFQSLRPTLASLEEDVSKHFSNYKLLDTGGSFVGVLIN